MPDTTPQQCHNSFLEIPVSDIPACAYDFAKNRLDMPDALRRVVQTPLQASINDYIHVAIVFGALIIAALVAMRLMETLFEAAEAADHSARQRRKEKAQNKAK